MEAVKEAFAYFLHSGLLPGVLLILRAVTPVAALYVVWRCYTSFKKGQRRRDPLIVLWDEGSGPASRCCIGKIPSAAAAAATSFCPIPRSPATTRC